MANVSCVDVLLVTHDRSLARNIRVDRTVDVAALSHWIDS